MWRNERGVLLLGTFFILSMVLLAITIGLTRTMTEVRAGTRFVANTQSVHVAEAGLHAALWEFEHSGGDFKIGSPATGGEGWTLLVSATTDPPCLVYNCRQQTFNFAESGGQALVTVFNSTANAPVIESLGSTWSATSRLRMFLLKNQKLPILGTITVVGQPRDVSDPDPAKWILADAEFNPGEFFDTNPVHKTNGCDASNGTAPCTHGLTLTTGKMYGEFVNYVKTQISPELLFADRLVGVRSDHPDWAALGSPPQYYYSVHSAPQDIVNGGLGYDYLKSLAAFVKTKAKDASNNCYFDVTNDNTSDIDHITLRNRTFGTLANPKLCFIDAPLQTLADGTYRYPDDANGSADQFEEVYLKDSIQGAGVLVVMGEVNMEPSCTLNYNGVIISMGPTGEVEFDNSTTVRGAVIVSTTHPSYDFVGGPQKWHKIEVELKNSLGGGIQYDSAKVSMAENLLSGWTPPGGNSASTRYTVQMWESR